MYCSEVARIAILRLCNVESNENQPRRTKAFGHEWVGFYTGCSETRNKIFEERTFKLSLTFHMSVKRKLLSHENFIRTPNFRQIIFSDNNFLRRPCSAIVSECWTRKNSVSSYTHMPLIFLENTIKFSVKLVYSMVELQPHILAQRNWCQSRILTRLYLPT